MIRLLEAPIFFAALGAVAALGLPSYGQEVADTTSLHFVKDMNRAVLLQRAEKELVLSGSNVGGLVIFYGDAAKQLYGDLARATKRADTIPSNGPNGVYRLTDFSCKASPEEFAVVRNQLGCVSFTGRPVEVAFACILSIDPMGTGTAARIGIAEIQDLLLWDELKGNPGEAPEARSSTEEAEATGESCAVPHSGNWSFSEGHIKVSSFANGLLRANGTEDGSLEFASDDKKTEAAAELYRSLTSLVSSGDVNDRRGSVLGTGRTGQNLLCEHRNGASFFCTIDFMLRSAGQFRRQPNQ